MMTGGYSFAIEKKTKELPFYFPEGVVVSTDPVQQVIENSRYFKATKSQFQSDRNDTSPLITGSDSLIIETEIESTSGASNRDKPTKMKLVLDHYVRMPNNRIRVTYLNKQFYITEEQLQAVIADLKETVITARDNISSFWSPAIDLAIKHWAAKLAIPEKELLKLLNLPAPEKSDITIRELNGLPRQSRLSDFVPRELHLGYNTELPGGILGVTWLNAGVIYYNPGARIRDYLTQKPMVLEHEMVHVNINLQELLLAQGFDPEIMASIPEMFYPENQIELLHHPYTAVIRELIHNYFGFDYIRAQKESFLWDYEGSLEIDEEKFRENSKRWQEIKAELLPFFQKKVVPEFYSNTTWWSAMNQKLQDKNSVFHIVMAANYNLTRLGGEKETQRWLETNENEIREIAERAYELSGTPLENTQPANNRLSALLLNEYQRLFTEKEQEKINIYFNRHPEMIEKLVEMEIPELIKFFLRFKTDPVKPEEGVR